MWSWWELQAIFPIPSLEDGPIPGRERPSRVFSEPLRSLSLAHVSPGMPRLLWLAHAKTAPHQLCDLPLPH